MTNPKGEPKAALTWPRPMPTSERELLIEALRVVDEWSALFNRLRALNPTDEQHEVLLQQLHPKSGVFLFVAADHLNVDLPDDLRCA